MQTFRKLFHQKTSHRQFKQLYERECHVCAFTMRIFEHLELRGIPLDQLAAEMQIDAGALMDLKAAEHCDPRMVIALCRQLDLDAPEACPKLKAAS